MTLKMVIQTDKHLYVKYLFNYTVARKRLWLVNSIWCPKPGSS